MTRWNEILLVHTLEKNREIKFIPVNISYVVRYNIIFILEEEA